jgi:hypothetical protein
MCLKWIARARTHTHTNTKYGLVSIPAFLVRVQGVTQSNLGGGQFVISLGFVQPLQQNGRQDRSFIDVHEKGVKNDCKLRREKTYDKESDTINTR